MKPRAIIADPMALYRMGLRCLVDMAALIHLGRCGLNGSVRPAMADALGVPYETLRSSLDRLEELKLVQESCHHSGRGRALLYIVSEDGWDALTRPADFSPFKAVQMPMEMTTPG